MAHSPDNKTAIVPDIDEHSHASSDHPTPPTAQKNEADDIIMPQNWMYKSSKLFGIKFPYYASPKAQLLLVAFVCFLCPGRVAALWAFGAGLVRYTDDANAIAGMFNAVNGLGGGGQLDGKASTDANTALYATFSVVGFFAGTITNTIGIRWALSFGGIGYCIYVSAYLVYNHTANLGYITFSGALLGVCAGVLWSAQGAIMMSYPTEAEKGRFISWFWMIFNLGSVIGSLIPLGQNINAKSAAAVSDGTYIGFLVLTFIGGCLAWTLVDAKSVIRSDGSKVILMKQPTWKSELLGLYQTLVSDPYIMLLFPMFFASNWFYTYQFNAFNLPRFTLRTRSLNNVLYWTMQIVGAYIFGNALDFARFKRTTRAIILWAVLFVLTFAIWGGGYAFERSFTRADYEANEDNAAWFIDWTEGRYIGPMFLYMFYGFYDAAWQTSVYWFMGAITNNARKLANLAGFYKGIQSAGAAIIWRVDGLGSPYASEFASTWGLLAGSLLFALPVMLMKIRDTVPLEDDLRFTDETIDDVVAHRHQSIDVEKA